MLSTRDQLVMFVLGAIETVPLFGGIGLSLYLDALPFYALILIGLALSVLVCWLLRKYVPQFPIHASSSDRKY
jgi:hypothetical protein